MKLLRINERDNVAVALENISAGYEEDGIKVIEDIPKAHKVALTDLRTGDIVKKYGCSIGHMTENVNAGGYVHEHNLKTNLGEQIEYSFSGDREYNPEKSELTVNAYVRENGKIGIRNDIWIIPTVGCVNKTCEALAGKFGDNVFAFTHPYGCSQMGDDMVNTQKILAGLVKHPNAGGVLVVSLGCENNNLGEFKKHLGSINENRVRFLCCQEVENELEEGAEIIDELLEIAAQDKRESVGIENLVVGYKCGGSDAFSGITANAVCGRLNDRLTKAGATTILTETPEMFGAEHILMSRCKNKTVFGKCVEMINGYKNYFEKHNQVCYENPSPGNHDGGITTLEEKSLGCIQKGGDSVVTDVLQYAQPVKTNGLNLLYGPGNDIVSTTNLTASGAHIILFTTGRGTSLGAPVPTIKLSSNSDLANRKSNWIDFDAQKQTVDELEQLLINVANGSQTKNEQNGYREIAIFKNGVTM